MNIRERIKSAILFGGFICYILLLTKILFLSRVSISELFHGGRTLDRSMNLIPFKSISEFIAGSSANLRRFAFGNVAGNILIFIPFGLYVVLLKSNKRVLNNLLVIFIVSLIVEIVQGVLAIGTADVDDVILNCVGGWMGILVYKSLLFLLRDENKAKSTITVLSVIVGFPVIYFYLFMIKMRF